MQDLLRLNILYIRQGAKNGPNTPVCFEFRELKNMNRGATLAVCTLSVGLVMISLFACGFLTIPKLGQKKIDTSWVNELDEYLNEAQPYPPPPSDWDLSDYFIYLYEDGQVYLVEYSGGGTKLVAFLEDLVDKAYNEINATLDQGFVNRLIASDKVVSLTYKYGLTYPSTRLEKVWFILQDNLNEDLTGTVVRAQTINNSEELSIWAILK